MTNTGGALEDALWAGVMTRRSLVRGGAGGVTVGEGAWQGRWHGALEGGSQFDVTFFVCKRSCAFFAVRKPCHPYRWGGGGGPWNPRHIYVCEILCPPPHPMVMVMVFVGFIWFSIVFVGFSNVESNLALLPPPCGWGGGGSPPPSPVGGVGGWGGGKRGNSESKFWPGGPEF